jgi:hypothetical protein
VLQGDFHQFLQHRALDPPPGSDQRTIIHIVLAVQHSRPFVVVHVLGIPRQ